MEYTVKTLRSARRTLCIEINTAGEVLLRAPYSATEQQIAYFLEAHRRWIEQHIDKISPEPERTPEQIASLRALAKEYLPARTAYFSRQMGLTPTGIKITSAKRRFGSCSGKNSLCFSLYLMEYPTEAIDYVIVHELAHIRHKNHSAAFHALIAEYLPDHLRRRQLLKGKHGN